MLRSISSFFPVLSNEMHQLLAIVENVREKEKMEASAASRLPSANERSTKICNDS